jgi:UDP-galactose transporter
MVGFMSSLSAAMLRINPAYAAALALVVIQVSIGILFKASQTDGKYSFSASSSVTISEFLKFVLATVFFYRECAAKHATSPRLPSQGPVFDQELDEEKQVNSDDDDGEDQAFLKSAGKVASRIGQFRTAGMAMDLKTFYGYVLEEMPSESRYGFSLLALFYVLINNTVFLQYRLSDPGTIQLIKSGTTLITAVVSLTFLGTKVARGQWLAISLQVCGIVTTQYKPSGATYPFSTYMVLLFATTVSAVASVYNQKLCKGVDASMHVMNMSLYSSGAAINLLLHLITRFIKPDEPGFFTGYGQIGAILVIVSNVLIGLVMTAVYKYADAIIKCFATAMSTAILLYISPILFGVDMSFLVLPGTSVVFIATWLYMEATPPRSSTPAASEPMPMSPTERSTVGKILYMLGPGGPFKHVGLGAATAVTLIIISLLTSWDASNTKSIQDDVDAAMPQLNNTQPLIPVLESPFKNTLAYVRWNSKHEERIPLIKTGYEQFFHTMHYSMPKLMGEDGNNFVNLTHDAWEDGYWGYRAVKNTMKVILNETTEDEIGGMMFFHFDVWLDPMGFEEMDFDKIWFPDSEDPKFRCMKNTERYKEWWGWGQGFHEKSQQATRFAANMHSHYEIDTEEWCVG